MATIKSLVVTLSANSAKLTKELGKTRKLVKKWAKGIAGTVAKIGGAFTGIAAIMGGALLVAINKNAAAIDDMTKAAGKLKFPIEDYQKFAFIAEKSNISMDVFGKSMQRMMKTVGDAKAGLSTASDALDQLGLSAGDLERLNPSKQFQLIAERMKGIVSQSDKVKVAMDVFGRSGADLLNVFQGDVKKIGDEFDGLGVAITKRQADMVAAFQDSKTTLFSLLGGLGKNLTAEVAPALTLITDKITAMIKKMGGMKVIANKFAKYIIKGIIVAIKGFKGFVDSLRELKITMIDIAATWKSSIAVLNLKPFSSKSFADQLKPVTDELNKMADKRMKLTLEIGNKSELQKSVESLLSDLNVSLSNVGGGKKKKTDLSQFTRKDGSIDYVAAAKARIDAEKKLVDQSAKTTEGLKSLADSAKATASIQQNANISDQFLQFIDQAKRGINSGSSFNDGNFTALNNLIQASKNNAALPETTKAMQDMVDSLRQVQASTQASAQAVQQQTQESKKSVGELTINMITDTGKIAGKIFGEPEFLDRLQIFVGNQTNDTARAVAN